MSNLIGDIKSGFNPIFPSYKFDVTGMIVSTENYDKALLSTAKKAGLTDKLNPIFPSGKFDVPGIIVSAKDRNK